MAWALGSDVQVAVREAADEAAVHADAHDRTATFPTEAFEVLRAGGLLGLTIPKRFGGLGGSLVDVVDVARELGSRCVSLAMIWAMHCQQVDAISRHAVDSLRADLLSEIARRQLYLGSITTEPTKAGSSVISTAAPLTNAPNAPNALFVERDAPVVTGGLHADGFLITMRDTPAVENESSTLVYVSRDQARVEQIGEPWDPMGMRSTESIGLHLAAVIPPSQVVGKRGGFRQIALESFVPFAHIGWSASWIGGVLGALRNLGVAERLQTSEAARQQLGRARLLTELVDCYAYGAATLVENYRTERITLDSPAVQVQLNTLKVAAAEMTNMALDILVELAGLKDGYLRGYLERTSRDLRSAPLNIANGPLLARTGTVALLDRNVKTLGYSVAHYERGVAPET